MENALKNVNKTSRDLNSELKDIEKSLKFNPGNSDLIAQKQKVLGEQIQNTSEKLRTLKEAHEQAKQQLANGTIGQDQFDALTREVIIAENQLKSFKNQLEHTSNSFIQFGKKAQAVGSKMTDIGKKMSIGVTAPLTAVGAGAMKAWSEVDEALDGIILKTGATGDKADELGENFKNVAGNIPTDMSKASDAIGEVNTQFQLTGPALEEASEYMVKFSEITGQDVTSATQGAKASMEVMGVEAGKLNQVLDAYAKTSQDTGIGTQQLMDIVTKGAPQFQAMGIDMGTAISMMGSFEQKGIDSGKALSYLSKAQATWAKDGLSMQDGLKQLQEQLVGASSETERISLASEVFGTKGGPFMAKAIKDGALNIEQFKQSLDGVSGKVGETFDATLDPVDNMNLAMNNLKLAGAELGNSMQTVVAPALQGLAEGVKSFAQWFGSLPEPVKQTILVIGGLAAAIGPLLVIIGTLISSVGTITTALAVIGGVAGIASGATTALGGAFTLLTGPIGIAIAVITALIAIGVLLYQNWDTIKAKAGEASQWISGKWTETTTAISNAWEGLKKSAGEKWEGIKSAVSDKVNQAKDFLSGVWDNVKTTVSGTWENIKSNTSTAWSNIKGKIEEHGCGIKGVIGTYVEAYKTLFSNGWNKVNELTGGRLGDMAKTVKDKVDSAKKWVSDGLANIKNSFTNLKLKLPEIKIPNIKLPHFKVNGDFSINPPRVPSIGVDWHKQGGIFTRPTIFNTPYGLHGVGEAGAEAVMPLSYLDKLIGKTVSDVITSSKDEIIINFTLSDIVIRSEQDIDLLAQKVTDKIARQIRNRKLAGGAYGV